MTLISITEELCGGQAQDLKPGPSLWEHLSVELYVELILFYF